MPVFSLDGLQLLFVDTTAVTLDLTQSDLTVAGTLHLLLQDGLDLPGTWSGTLEAASSPTMMQFEAKYAATGPTGAPCEGTFKGTLDATTQEIQGSFTGNSCSRSFAGNLHATKDG